MQRSEACWTWRCPGKRNKRGRVRLVEPACRAELTGWSARDGSSGKIRPKGRSLRSVPVLGSSLSAGQRNSGPAAARIAPPPSVPDAPRGSGLPAPPPHMARAQPKLQVSSPPPVSSLHKRCTLILRRHHLPSLNPPQPPCSLFFPAYGPRRASAAAPNRDPPP